ncbi:MAG: hypothetical protein UT65_C0028G0005 [Parcubacteria group bacterium GW2011_GWF2_39_8b]|uniref:Uncharacterized protein n=2 Tax=Candidatus Zambryskiibacteriota TaxID=1817925 RepID=A0A1G2UWV5_9BACT|nr:MAG: hypothetical protein UT65_C0028G0005 [Parcubacteria group bacterium GW2011_GWF2_39_8b]KKR45187.1 MAG: hypothetical protein UT81_C0019G0007 [Parcubacteria group bacterium GW2011_GWA2_40_14]OHA95366.1 MAG: hypothetical protein A3C63_01165 [Candidatus Zambryskibacteria bacterium RIFCSPHIGHO2_02_FULL_39_82]OHA98545.1 MAG: hypothetical protein A3E32_03195 [Candidatus Zambryskibacteria bacterium RIFCSPHIGHO2_12_FULL_38_37]OHB07385.1 MAG: hypothetical protein A2W64_00495 [Candidatus Zambryskib
MHKDDVALTCGYGLGKETFNLSVEQYIRMYEESITQAVIASSAIEGEVLTDREVEFLHQDSEKRIGRALARLNVKPK